MSLTKVSYSMINASVVSPRDYGAVSYTGLYNGEADASTAINAAIAACPDGGVIELSGKYYVANPINIRKKNITFCNGVIEVATNYTNEVISIWPDTTNAPQNDVTASTVRDIRIQTTGREESASTNWFGQFIGIQFQTAERPSIWCNFEDVFISFPYVGILWSQITTSPSGTAGFTNCASFNALKIEGYQQAAIEIASNSGSNIYSGQVIGNAFVNCMFSHAGVNAPFILDQNTGEGEELEFTNSVLFNDSANTNGPLVSSNGYPKIRIQGGYWELFPNYFVRKNVYVSNARIIAPNKYTANPGYTTTLPAFSATDNNTNLLTRNFDAWTTISTGTLTPVNIFYQTNPVYSFATGATGSIGYAVPSSANFSNAGSLIFSCLVQQQATIEPGWSTYVNLTYSDASTDTFVGQQAPQTLDWQPLAVVFTPAAGKTISSFGIIIQGPANETLRVCAPMLSVGTSISLYPQKVINPNFVETYSGPVIDGRNYASSAAQGVSVYYPNITGGTATNFFNGADFTQTWITIFGNGDVKNRTGVYGTLSDARAKENIVDAPDYFDRLRKIRIVNYNLIGDNTKLLGKVAQEVEKIFPNLVFEHQEYEIKEEAIEKDGKIEFVTKQIPKGDPVKGVKDSIFINMLIQAVQKLADEVDALKAAK